MSDSFEYRMTFGEQASGKWQIPAFVLSLVALTVVALQVESPTRKIGIDENLSRINRLINAQLFVPALDLARHLQTWEDISDQDRSRLHAYEARAMYERAKSSGKLTTQDAGNTLAQYKLAIDLKFPLGAVDHRRIAECHEANGQLLLARSHYQAAVDIGVPPALADRREIITLGIRLSNILDDETFALLASFCDDAADSPDDLFWAVEQRVNLLIRQGDAEDIAALLDRYREQFQGTQYAPHLEYLTLLGMRGAGRYDEAELGLRALLNDVTDDHPVWDRASWLLGSIVLNDGGAQRPEEAISIFRNVVSARRDRSYVTASLLGMAEASALLQRFEDAMESYAKVIDEMRRPAGIEQVTPDGLLAAISASADLAHASDDMNHAIGFLKQAAGLINPEDNDTMARVLSRLGHFQSIAARSYGAQDPVSGEADPQRNADQTAAQLGDTWSADHARQLFNDAGETFVKVSWLSTLNEERASDMMWTAAGLFDEGGNHERAIEILQAFVRDRADAEIIPRVLLRLGKSLQAMGRCEEAVEAYQRNISSYPRSPFANAALIPLAECLMERGGEFEAQAEEALLQIKRDSEIFTPDAVEFRDALFLMGELYGRRTAYEKAIPVLEEFILRYPEDERLTRGRFLLADAYRQSALAIKEEVLQPEFVGESKRLRFEIDRRLGIAAKHFRQLIDDMALGEADLDELGFVYLQDARLYEASCLFELERYSEALNLYERIAWVYKDRPAALGAYVQVINCYVLLGKPTEAASALRRAQYLVGVIDEEYFAATGELETRESWRQHFEWVAEVLADG
jgi:tetratricopeptide (TPR) repeat protein